MFDLNQQWEDALHQYISPLSSVGYTWNCTRVEIEEKTQYAKTLFANKLTEIVNDALTASQTGEKNIPTPSNQEFLEALQYLTIEQTETIISTLSKIRINDQTFLDVGLEEREDESNRADNTLDRGLEFVEENGMDAIFEDGLTHGDDIDELWSKLSASQCIAIITSLYPDTIEVPEHQKNAIGHILSICNPLPTSIQINIINAKYALHIPVPTMPDSNRGEFDI